MTLQNLSRILDKYEQQFGITDRQQFELLKGLPFYNWHNPQDTKTFNHAIGLPQKNGQSYPLFDYEKMLFNELQQHQHIWCKKATGLGITEFMLRYMAWLCFGNKYQQNMCIVTGPRIELAITLIDRIKGLFSRINPTVSFDTKETVIELNGVHIEAYPSHHLDAMRGLKDVSFIYLDEADFFPPGQQQDARDVSERYIGKSDPHIVMVSTPNAPDGLFERIEKEPEQTCLYKRLFMDYTYGLNRIYTQQEIDNAKRSPSFEREYNLKYLGLIGNVFHTKDIERAIAEGKNIQTTVSSDYTSMSVGIDPGFGSSSFGICITEIVNDKVNVLFAEEYPRPDFNQIIDVTVGLFNKFGITFDNDCRVFVDGANPEVIRALKARVYENTDYDMEISRIKSNVGSDYSLKYLMWNMFIIPVPFSKEHKHMLAHCKKLLEYDKGQVAIHPRFNKLITSLRTAVEKGDGSLDKEATSHNDCFDAFRLSLLRYR